jgi:hypothetical protein
MGPEVDTTLDETLQSLGKIAQKHAKSVVDSIMRWRRSQYEPVSAEMLRAYTSSSPSHSYRRPAVTVDIPALLNERKSLASIYIMCRALIAVLKSIEGVKDALGEALGYSLEDTTFAQFRKPNLNLLVTSVNHRINAELYAALLGHIANVR